MYQFCLAPGCVGVFGGITGTASCEDMGSAGVEFTSSTAVLDLANWVFRPAGAGFVLHGQMSLMESMKAAATSDVWKVIWKRLNIFRGATSSCQCTQGGYMRTGEEPAGTMRGCMYRMPTTVSR